ncbi:hypothetical protein V6N13_024731 [Hibiscus sabdariffa]|uniref:Uncharacterized protein n=2 Tax=Hibiscus sabdariffa TaxID=183260 RepID=A0ABR2QG78_9ROSI
MDKVPSSYLRLEKNIFELELLRSSAREQVFKSYDFFTNVRKALRSLTLAWITLGSVQEKARGQIFGQEAGQVSGGVDNVQTTVTLSKVKPVNVVSDTAVKTKRERGRPRKGTSLVSSRQPLFQLVTLLG